VTYWSQLIVMTVVAPLLLGVLSGARSGSGAVGVLCGLLCGASAGVIGLSVLRMSRSLVEHKKAISALKTITDSQAMFLFALSLALAFTLAVGLCKLAQCTTISLISALR